MNIRAETTEDIAAIDALTYRAFENHPHHKPGAKPSEHLIINQLRQANALTLSLVYEDHTGIVGHIALSPITINHAADQWYGLGPISVAPERQGQGIGSALIQAGLEQIKTMGAQGVALLGEPQYYGRFGFKQLDELTLPGVPAEYFLAKVFSAEIPTGSVSYHPAFLVTD
ncbi:GNAT family N-acetyltransferase [Shewanella waksmanii]|uniref:GNAT family N-acetyltransferase n=1 Tax=Shewanella waksmanii TaxID=213783 RepID=UPI003736D46C